MRSRTAAAWLVRILLLVFTGSFLWVPGVSADAPPDPSPFTFQWMGDPPLPEPWRPDSWDLIVHARDERTWMQLDPMPAQHGSACEPPPATHRVTAYEDAVFICDNHMMTAFLPGGYGEIEFAPDHMADWSSGTTVISWHQSTFRTSPRDWTDVLVSPFDENMVLPGHTSVDLSGRPRDAIHVEMSSSFPTTFDGAIVDNFKATTITTGHPALEGIVTPSASTRTHFQLEISRNHLRFGIPETGTWWIDRDVPSLSFTRGVVQLGHHSFTPDKDCEPKPAVLSCTGDTWHWSDFSISSAVPFTMLRGQTGADEYVTHDHSETVRFPAPAPPDSHLRFAANGGISISTDGGKTWTGVLPQPSERNPTGDYVQDSFASYWLPVPAGTTSVMFSGKDDDAGWWWVKDPSIWSSEQPVPVASLAPSASSAAPPVAAVMPGPRARTSTGLPAGLPATLSARVQALPPPLPRLVVLLLLSAMTTAFAGLVAWARR
jgi:hypothetical protein